MPFKSDAQRRFMYSQHPAIAKRWRAESGPQKDLPEHKGKPMQTRGTFPDLSSGQKKRTNHTGKYRKAASGGMGGFSVKGKGPRTQPTNPKGFAARRTASHAAARRKY